MIEITHCSICGDKLTMEESENVAVGATTGKCEGCIEEDMRQAEAQADN